MLLRNISDLKFNLDNIPQNDWLSSISAAYFNILYSLKFKFTDGYTLYMQNNKFQIKQIETIIGAYTEFRHESSLYNKYEEGPEMGDDYELYEYPLAKGFVEPNIKFWDNILIFLTYLENIYLKFNIFPHDTGEDGNLNTFKQIIMRFRNISIKELSGEYLTKDDYEFIRTTQLRYYSVQRVNNTYLYPNIVQRLSAKVIDIMDFDDLSVTENFNCGNGTLYEAIGAPSLMLVLVGNENTDRITVGVAYNHYEFILKSDTRLTDCDWQSVAYDLEPKPNSNWPDCLMSSELITELPPKNFWYDGLR
jgi:hypothetical protein